MILSHTPVVSFRTVKDKDENCHLSKIQRHTLFPSPCQTPVLLLFHAEVALSSDVIDAHWANKAVNRYLSHQNNFLLTEGVMIINKRFLSLTFRVLLGKTYLRTLNGVL